MSEVARVLIDSRLPQLDRLFDYRIPASLREHTHPGVRVRVPFRGGRSVNGYVIEVVAQSSFEGDLDDVHQVVSPVAVLRREVLELLRGAAERSAGNLADIVRVAIPGRQARVEKRWLQTHDPVSGCAHSVTMHGPFTRPALQHGVRSVLDVEAGVATVKGAPIGRWAVQLAARAKAVVDSGEQVIIAAPDAREIAQLEIALSAVVPTELIARVDAEQGNPDRYAGFLRAIEGGPLVILGARSAVYAPATELGLLIVWDDGDPLHSEPLAPGVHARDAALIRAQQTRCELIFAAHARSLESQRLIEIGYCQEILRRERPAKLVPTALAAEEQRAARIPTFAWRTAADALREGPVLVQVATPGFSPMLRCSRCEERAHCAVCGGVLQRDRPGGIPTCTVCGASAPVWECTVCHGTSLKSTVIGSERTAHELGKAFPGVKVIVSDGSRPVQTVDDEPALIIATRGAEPVAEDGYRAVLLLDARRMLAREALRVAEDCVRWWSRARSLAARDATVVLVGVGGYLAADMTSDSTASFARRELEERRALRFPPAVRVATVTGKASEVSAVLARMGENDHIDVLGPVEIPEQRVRSILRFDYSQGPMVATHLRAELVRAASGQRGAGPQSRGIRVRLDDPDPFRGV
ncbi:primosomal protein N' [Humidisolicoccus flavus]|uniref:primosomal protein N' family DNA-binding protein n=1 Tax=Humidisolicoccus flavus TaxID=3111414 RepID=UPI00324F2316